MLTSMSHTAMRFSSLPSFIAFISSTQVIPPASSPSHFVQVFNVIGSKLQGWGHLWHQHLHNCHCTHPQHDKMIVIVHLTPISIPLAKCFVRHLLLVRSSLFVYSLFGLSLFVQCLFVCRWFVFHSSFILCSFINCLFINHSFIYRSFIHCWSFIVCSSFAHHHSFIACSLFVVHRLFVC